MNTLQIQCAPSFPSLPSAVRKWVFYNGHVCTLTHPCTYTYIIRVSCPFVCDSFIAAMLSLMVWRLIAARVFERSCALSTVSTAMNRSWIVTVIDSPFFFISRLFFPLLILAYPAFLKCLFRLLKSYCCVTVLGNHFKIQMSLSCCTWCTKKIYATLTWLGPTKLKAIDQPNYIFSSSRKACIHFEHANNRYIYWIKLLKLNFL